MVRQCTATAKKKNKAQKMLEISVVFPISQAEDISETDMFLLH